MVTSALFVLAVVVMVVIVMVVMALSWQEPLTITRRLYLL
jgi:hypothetical protein